MLIVLAQYDVVFPNEYILDTEADAQLSMMTGIKDRRSRRTRSKADTSGAQLIGGKEEPDFKDDAEEEALLAHGIDGYEEMLLNERRFLCQVPAVESNKTSNVSETNSVSHAKELARATSHGLELLSDLDGSCLYFLAGWWAYSFCYGKEAQQFHPLQPRRGVPLYPPRPDPNMPVYVLGEYPPLDEAQQVRRRRSEKSGKQNTKALARLESKGDMPYLVQQLGRGTKCSLTIKDRRVEVQFHCDPKAADHIAYIKETTTCQYLIVIHTPKLCHDEAFLPPQRDDVHAIQCREILSEETASRWEIPEKQEHISVEEPLKVDSSNESPDNTLPLVGEIRVGARSIMKPYGRPSDKEKIDDLFKDDPDYDDKTESVKTLASSRGDGENAQAKSKKELESLGLSEEQLERLQKKMEQLSQGRDWRLEMVTVEEDGASVLRWMIDKPEGDDEIEAKDRSQGMENSQHNQHEAGDNKENTIQQRKDDMNVKKDKEEGGPKSKQPTDGNEDHDAEAKRQSKQKKRKQSAYKEEL